MGGLVIIAVGGLGACQNVATACFRGNHPGKDDMLLPMHWVWPNEMTRGPVRLVKVSRCSQYTHDVVDSNTKEWQRSVSPVSPVKAAVACSSLKKNLSIEPSHKCLTCNSELRSVTRNSKQTK